jgi:hypothetical protein
MSLKNNPKPGQVVVLTEAPPELLRNLPKEDCNAIYAIIGQPIVLVGYDKDGRAELQFVDGEGQYHSIWVDPIKLRAVK